MGFMHTYLKKNKGHTIDWDQAVFLDKEKNWSGRKVKEALFINAQNPTKEINREKVMNLEKGFALDPIWGDFNAEIRKIMSKKMKKCLEIFYCCVFHFLQGSYGYNCMRVCQLSFH